MRLFDTSSKDTLWSLVWPVSAVYWAIIAATDVLVSWPFAGSHINGVYVLSNGARLLAYSWEFMVSSCLYYLALRRGWPRGAYARGGAVAVQLILGLTFFAAAWLGMCFSVGLIDRDWQDLKDTLGGSWHFQWSAVEWAWRLNAPKYALGLVLVALVRQFRQYQNEALRTAKLSAEYANTRLGLLAAQLQPHFLFNALHVITELVSEQPSRATEMLERLGVFLRHALETSKQPWVSLSAELRGLEAYVAVQQVRFGERLAVQFAVDPATTGYLLPSLLLQPLVENAIEHGRGAGKEQLLVRIVVTRSADRLHIVISNSMPTLAGLLPVSAHGYGLHNVTNRLRAAYGTGADLAVGPGAGGGTQAQIYLPVHEAPPRAIAIERSDWSRTSVDVTASYQYPGR